MTEAAPTDWAIRTHGLRKTYRRGSVVAVADLDLSVPRGGVHALLGPNGSGKTTTLRMLLGLVRPDAGSIEILGQPVPDALASVIDQVGAIVESPKFFPTMSARTNLIILAEGIGAPASRVDEVLDQVGLTGRARDDVRRYSLGMRQRLAIASTLLKDPQVFLYDEPTNGLDPAGIHEVRQTMRALADAGRTVVLSSHLLAEVQQVADTVSFLGRGRLLREGNVADLLAASGRVRVRVTPTDAAAHTLIGAGLEVNPTPDGALVVGQPSGVVDAAAIARLLGEAGLWPSELTPVTDNLEQVFLTITQREQLTSAAWAPATREEGAA